MELIGKIQYPIKAYYIDVEKGGILEGRKDVPEAVRDKLYGEEQERHKRLGKDKRKGGPIIRSKVPYPPYNIIINTLPP